MVCVRYPWRPMLQPFQPPLFHLDSRIVTLAAITLYRTRRLPPQEVPHESLLLPDESSLCDGSMSAILEAVSRSSIACQRLISRTATSSWSSTDLAPWSPSPQKLFSSHCHPSHWQGKLLRCSVKPLEEH